MESPIAGGSKQDRALRALEVALITGFPQSVQSAQTSCVSLCTACREHVPVGCLRVCAGVPSTIFEVIGSPANAHPAENGHSSRVKPHRRALRIHWTFDDSPSNDWWAVETDEVVRDSHQVGRTTGVSIDTPKVRWPEGTKEIILCCFNRGVDALNFPVSLERLCFGESPSLAPTTIGVRDMFNMPLTGFVFPARLREIFFGDSFNQPIEGVTWPVGLERLSMPGSNHSIGNVEWPAGLKALEFVSPSTIKIWGLRDFSGMYSYSGSFHDPIAINSRPGHGQFDQPLSTTLPPRLETLWLSTCFGKPLDSVSWPKGIVTLGLAFNFKSYRFSESVAWPSNLRHLCMVNRPDRNEGLSYPRHSKISIVSAYCCGLSWAHSIDIYERGEDPNYPSRMHNHYSAVETI